MNPFDRFDLPEPPPGILRDPNAPPGMLEQPSPPGPERGLRAKVGNPEVDSGNTFDMFDAEPQAQATQPLNPALPAASAFDQFDSSSYADTLKSLYGRAVQGTSAAIPGFLYGFGENRRAKLIEELKRRELLDHEGEEAYKRYVVDPNNKLGGSYAIAPRSKEQILSDIMAEEHDINIQRSAYESAQAELEARRPPNENIIQRGIGAAAESSATTLAGVSLALAGLPTVGTAVAMGGGGMQQYGSSYAEARSKGASHEVAHRSAIVDALLEAGGEKLEFGALTKEGQSFIRKMLTSIAVGSGQEAATQLGQDINAKLNYDPNMTVRDILADMAVAGVAGAAGAGAATPVIHGAEVARKGAQERAQDRFVEQEMERGFAGMPTPEQEAVAALSPPQPEVSRPYAPTERYGLQPTPYETTTTLKPIELQLMDEGHDLGPAWKEVGEYKQQLESYADQGVMPLLPYEVKELDSATRVLDILKEEHISKAVLQQAAKPGTLTRMILDQSPGIENPNVRANLTATIQRIYDDYTERATTGEPTARGVGQELPVPVGVTYPGRIAWSSQGVPGEGAELSQFVPGGVHVLEDAGRTAEENKRLIAAGKVVRAWADKMGFKNKLNIFMTNLPKDSSPFGDQQLFDENSIRIRLNLDEHPTYSNEFWATNAHELGHGLTWRMLLNSTPKIQEAIRRLWANDTRTAQAGEEASLQLTGPSEPWSTTKADQALDYVGKQRLRNYYFSYGEWLAHRFERMLRGDFMGMQKDIEAVLGDKTLAASVMRFLKNAWNGLKAAYEQYKGKVGRTEADDTFEAFVKMHARMAEAGVDNLSAIGSPNQTPTNWGQQPPGAVAASLPQDGGPPKIPPISKSTGRPSTPSSRSFDHELDRFGKFRKVFTDLLHLAKTNPHIEDLVNPVGVVDPLTGQMRYGYIDYTRMLSTERMTWTSRADLRLREWRKLPTKQRDILSTFMFDQTLAKKFSDLTNPQVRAKYPFTAEALDLYNKIKNDFESFNKSVEEMLVNETLRRLGNNPFVQSHVAEIHKKFEAMRAVPYFPLTHFGPYYTLVRDPKGKVVASPSYESRAEQLLKKGKLAKTYPGHSLEMRKGSEIAQAFAGIRPEIIEVLKDRLSLTPDQSKALDQYLLEIAPGQGYSKHLMQRRFTPGFTRDAQRQYASYFTKGAGFLARAKYGQSMREAIARIEQSAKEPGVPDSITRQMIADYAQIHYNYLMDPKTEWTGFRAALATFALALRLPTVLVNLQQPVMFTYPYLAARYSDLKALRAIQQAYVDLPKSFHTTRPMDVPTQQAYDKWIKNVPLSPQEDALLTKFTGQERDLRLALKKAESEGVIDQSLAMELAAAQRGGFLVRPGSPLGSLAYLARQTSRALMIPFEFAERINRRVAFTATFRLARQAGMNPDQAYLAARDGVEQTQFQYERWNRPLLMRGRRGAFFMFATYQLSALRFLMGGDPGWWRALAMLLLMGGLEGLPFAEDLENLASWMLTSTNVRFNAKKWLKDQVEKLGGIFEDHPDLLLRGISRYAGPVDLSNSVSMGRQIPGLSAVTQPGDWKDRLIATERDAGGYLTATTLNAYRAVTDSTMPLERRIELGMPMAFIKSALEGERWYEKGSAESLSGADIADVTPTEAALKSLGFSIRNVNQAMEELRTRNDFVTFYTTRRAQLSTDFDRALQDGDREQIEEAKDAIRTYNEEVPVSGLKINPSEIVQSHVEREKARRAEEAGVGKSKLERAIIRGMGDL